MKLKRKDRAADREPFALPTEKSEPMGNLQDFVYWFYGPPKIGKTTLTQMFPNTLHAMFEDGAKALSLHKVQITEWPDVDKLIKAVRKSKKFDNVAVDIVEGMYGLAWDHFLNKLDIEHPSDLEYGKGWDAVASPFVRALKKLMGMPNKGCQLISHAKTGDRKTADGDTVSDIHPGLSGAPLEKVAGLVDVIGYYHFRKGKRVLQIRGDDDVMAGCRLEANFCYTDGSPIKYIPMGESKADSFNNFQAAFNNELDRPVEKEKSGLRLRKKKRK